MVKVDTYRHTTCTEGSLVIKSLISLELDDKCFYYENCKYDLQT